MAIFWRHVASVRVGIFLLAFLAIALSGSAQIITLNDNNSTVQLDAGSQSGMFNWFVDGNDYLAQQWFWYRVGTNSPEASINTISAPTITTPNARTAYISYFNGSVGVEVDYTLTGFSSGSGISDVGESIRITNGTASALSLHFFQYSNFNLSTNDSVQLGTSLSGLYNEARQTGGGAQLSETVITPGANRGEVAFVPVTLNKLNDALPTDLSNNAGPLGPGDVTWALQWDLTIPAFSSVGISKDKYLQIPEPTTLGLVSLGLLAFVLHRRRR